MPSLDRDDLRVALALPLALSCGVAAAPADTLLLNPFHDPFVQAISGRPCPPPLGPAYTDAQRRAEAHARIERGTSCWLAGSCSEPNAYRYDARIADAAAAALRADAALAGSTIWVIAQRRFIELQGCVTDAAQAARAQALVQAVPDVQAVWARLAVPGQTPAYPLAASAPAR